ncbi:hypothetical protein [Streptomyces sp. NPDC059009]|uniref:hypothetical protein n=1 Tax=Streptomyces sp. NPDC059009 TaxID=3346694 RepID=UPI0036C7F268
MPRGRHRHSPPLHRLLPPSAVAGFSVLCAGGAWAFTEPVVLRGLVSAAAAAAVVGSFVMRRWDLTAGKRVADLARSRASDEWRHEERIAEFESDLEESRELRGKLETKLRSKRAELAALRNEHAALLRRYATAETERASALEGRRLLAIEATAPARALPPGAPVRNARTTTTGPEQAARPAPAAQPAPPARHARPATSPTPSLYLRANAALARLEKGGSAGAAAAESGTGEAPSGQSEAAPTGQSEVASEGQPEVASEGTSGTAESQGRDRGQEHPVAGQHFTVPAAAAVVPPAPVRRPAVEGGFDFFGTKSVAKAAAAPAALEAVQNEDLADVVGEEALAVHKAESEAEFKQGSPDDAERGVGQVIDLTAHDETEQIDVGRLRTALQA